MRKQGRLYQDASEVVSMLAEVASWMAIQLLTTAVIHHSCGDRVDQIDQEIDPLRSRMVQWGSLNAFLGHQKQANANRQMAP